MNYQLNVIQWLMILAIIAMPVYCLFDGDKTKQAVIAGVKSKRSMYKSTMLFLWLPTGVLIYGLMFGYLSFESLGLVWLSTTANWVGVGLVVATAGYFVLSTLSVKANPKLQAEMSAAYQQHSWMMPTSKNELRWFTGGVSVSAGICEELLFRGFVLSLADDLSMSLGLLLVSSVLFGLCHLYQGWGNVLRTGVVGMVLGVIYLLTDSLWVPIALHILVDAYGGVMCYLVLTREHQDLVATY
ncbi:MAG: type II CAAX endopeptidase family protein [Kangiellaceae bacterium]|jgi:membrane protease YdiL (CAAX protease family)|nr:type II CAAX endopeptidase family protein [Kangiellaceae bacterium]